MLLLLFSHLFHCSSLITYTHTRVDCCTCDWRFDYYYVIMICCCCAMCCWWYYLFQSLLLSSKTDFLGWNEMEICFGSFVVVVIFFCFVCCCFFIKLLYCTHTHRNQNVLDDLAPLRLHNLHTTVFTLLLRWYHIIPTECSELRLHVKNLKKKNIFFRIFY